MNFLFLIVSPYKFLNTLCGSLFFFELHFIIAISIVVMMPFVWMSSDESAGIAKHSFFFLIIISLRKRPESAAIYMRSGCTKHLSYISNFHAAERRATFIFARVVCIKMYASSFICVHTCAMLRYYVVSEPRFVTHTHWCGGMAFIYKTLKLNTKSWTSAFK